jgi:hypothetical protein
MTQRRRQGLFWSRLHFLIRFLGLSGLLVGCIGLVLLQLMGRLSSWQAASDALRTPDAVAWLVLGGAAAAAPALLVELLVGLWAASARRSAFGLNVVVQVVLAAALLVGVNAFAFLHPHRFDWTRSHEYTVPAELQPDLRRLNDETTIVIYLRHRTTAADGDKPDRYDFAAERKVVEKVKDLVQELREFGPRFRVETLDVEEEGYDEKLKNVTKDAPELLRAIESAPENTLFFASNGRVQSMPFNEFYRLEKVYSREADNGRGNLVLSPVGLQPTANGISPVHDRILNLEERKPRVGVLVVHEALTTEGELDIYTLAGVRKALEAHGFEVRDVVLKRWGAGLTPAVDRLADSQLDRLYDERDALDDKIKVHGRELEALKKLVADWPNGKAPELGERINKYAEDYDPSIFVMVQSNDILVTPAMKQRLLDRLRSNLAFVQEIVDLDKREREEVGKELAGLDENGVRERQRMTDLRAKLDRELADCDMLLVPRQTIMNDGNTIVEGLPDVHDLTVEQTAAVKEFMRQGKPVFACFGPRNQPFEGASPPDGLEKLFADLGVHFSKKVVLYNAQVKAFAERNASRFRKPEMLKLPSLRLDSGESSEEDVNSPFASPTGAVAALGASAQNPLAVGAFVPPAAPPTLSPNPVRESLRLTEQSTGRPFDLTVRYPRPVYIDDEARKSLQFDPDVLTADRASWNDDQPFRTLERPIPSYSPPDRKDPDNFTPEARRRGPFTVGVALATAVPKSWLSSAADTPARLRVAAIGHGGVFIGKELSPSQEELLLDTCNWLLGRDDRLAHKAEQWRYPRVQMSDYDQTLWLWGARLGLPLLFAYLGAVVLLLRRLR